MTELNFKLKRITGTCDNPYPFTCQSIFASEDERREDEGVRIVAHNSLDSDAQPCN